MIIPITSADDPRIAHYRDLKDRELARHGGLFIAEGEHLVRRLLASSFTVESVLLADKHVAEIAPLVPEPVSVYAAPHSLVHGIVGYKFHSGVMAVGRRKPPVALEELASRWPERLTLVILPETANTDNLGSLIRISAGFGVDAVILGDRCCDPFYRQSVRVSMGTVFHVPIVQSPDLLADLARLRQRWNVDLAAAVLEADAQPLATCGRPPRLGLLLGNEAQGLAPEHIAAATRRITIPMQLGTDSLNVSVAAGIMLYHFTQRA